MVTSGFKSSGHLSVSSTSFQKSNIGRPQQPPTEKVLKFNLRFLDSTKTFFTQNFKKVELNNLGNSEVLSSDFQGLKPQQPL